MIFFLDCQIPLFVEQIKIKKRKQTLIAHVLLHSLRKSFTNNTDYTKKHHRDKIMFLLYYIFDC